MSDGLPFKSPEVTDEDIRWATHLLKLPEEAFFGKDGTDPRCAVLKSMEQVDVAACPGSGKTTLLVAKLAILAAKWPYRTRGICVLSHTNVARGEIETGLGSTTAGQRLLSYPHYIGTIHGFVNEFLALPWLRAQGYPIKMVDTDVCLRLRWSALKPTTRSGLEKNHLDHSILPVKSSDFSVGQIGWGKGNSLGASTPTYQDIQDVCRRSAKAGYFCYDEMFMWAENLMDQMPIAIEVIRDRFPLLFIDEAQDNREEQSAILYRIFQDGGSTVIRQRFGDSNQAIFDSMLTDEAQTDRFPNDAIKRDLPNSHRFGQRIADLSDPLAPIPCGLKGNGPKKLLSSGVSEGCHTIFLFNDDSANRIINAYGELLIETFSEHELREGTFKAIGQIHREGTYKTIGQIHKDKGDDHAPRHVGYYWPDYDPELTSRDPKPQTLVQYVFAGVERAAMAGEVYSAIEKIADGILRLAGMVKGKKIFPHGRHSHRYVLELLKGCADDRERYGDLLTRLAVRQEALTKETWNDHWRGVVREIAGRLAGAPPSGSEVDEFLAWKDGSDSITSQSVARKSRDNIYRYAKDGKEVAIRVGSIHSVKGETHTATLVLETFWQDRKGRHNLELLLPWLEGTKTGSQSDGPQQNKRLRLHYVAMTRPTHLLCLAMKLSTFMDSKGGLDQEKLKKLKQRGWQVKVV